MRFSWRKRSDAEPISPFPKSKILPQKGGFARRCLRYYAPERDVLCALALTICSPERSQ
jgi:hypothetical protein